MFTEFNILNKKHRRIYQYNEDDLGFQFFGYQALIHLDTHKQETDKLPINSFTCKILNKKKLDKKCCLHFIDIKADHPGNAGVVR